VYPKIFSAPGFHDVMMPSRVLLTMASSEEAMIADKSEATPSNPDFLSRGLASEPSCIIMQHLEHIFLRKKPSTQVQQIRKCGVFTRYGLSSTISRLMPDAGYRCPEKSLKLAAVSH
jgi:hypothetical protein